MLLDSLNLTENHPSLSLFYLVLFQHRQENRWLDLASIYLRMISVATEQSPYDNLSLSKGISGIAFLLSEATPHFTHHRNRLDEYLCKEVLKSSWIHPSYLVLNYDVIAGVSGIIAYLLRGEEHSPLKQQAIEYLLSLLITFFLGPKDKAQSKTSWFPRWSIPLQGTSPLVWEVNCGLAHGIPGPLAALSLASLAGYDLPGQREAIQYGASWLCEHFLLTSWGIDWPDKLSDAVMMKHVTPARSAWCYGTPGILRALSLASNVLSEDTAVKGVVFEGLQSLLRRPVATRNIDPLTLCHGNAGLLLVLLHFWQEMQLPELLSPIRELVTTILEKFNEKHIFGFPYQFRGKRVESSGLLYGVTGTALVLLSAATSVTPRWDRLLLVS